MNEPVPRVLPEEVLAHSSEGDVWVTVFGKVLDVSDLASPSPTGSLAARTLFAYAGKDVSHFFDRDTFDVAHFIHPATGDRTPMAAMMASPDDVSCSLPAPASSSWWRNPSRLRGRITDRSRPIRIVDSFSSLEVLLWVCCEDTLDRILDRYRAYNSAIDSYDCVRAGAVREDDDDRPLDRARTLQENGVEDERDLFSALGLPEDLYVPALLLIRRDDLYTVPAANERQSG